MLLVQSRSDVMDIRWSVFAVVAFTLSLLVALLVVELPIKKPKAQDPSVSARLARLQARLDNLDQQISLVRCRVDSLRALSKGKR
jgi:hypothetical protein